MRVALLAPLWKTVPPQQYGGVELVVANLANGLGALGHEVTTFACGGSQPSGEVVDVIPKPMYELRGGFDWGAVQAYEFLSFFELGNRIREFDIVHNHMGLHPVAFAPLLSTPLLTTMHSSLPPDFPYLAAAFKAYPFVSISDAQRTLAPMLNYIATIYHGIDVEAFEPRLEGSGNGFVFLGTVSHNKGADIAVRTARELNVPLFIAGEVRDADKSFVDSEVMPYVDGVNIAFLGEVGHKEKARLLREADAVLFPSRWNEAFGLVVAEAFACGTPVVALRNGAMPEIVDDGVTGFLADEASFVNMARNVNALSRKECRKAAEMRFNHTTMAQAHSALYESLVRSR